MLSFADVGALAWYLKHVPWVMPEFSIDRHRKRLEELHGTGAMTVPQPIFWLAARKLHWRQAVTSNHSAPR